MATNITARLSSLRKEKGLSQKEAAAGLGVSQALLSHYENGIRECGLDFSLPRGGLLQCHHGLPAGAERIEARI